jgi:hypothetical protein
MIWKNFKRNTVLLGTCSIFFIIQQCYFKLTVYTNYLEILLKCRFSLIRSGVGLRVCICNQQPDIADAEAVGLLRTLSSKVIGKI